MDINGCAPDGMGMTPCDVYNSPCINLMPAQALLAMSEYNCTICTNVYMRYEANCSGE